jgi:hypothetical protein
MLENPNCEIAPTPLQLPRRDSDEPNAREPITDALYNEPQWTEPKTDMDEPKRTIEERKEIEDPSSKQETTDTCEPFGPTQYPLKDKDEDRRNSLRTDNASPAYT